MNSLEKKIKEITDRILEYTKEIDNLNNRDEELATEKEYYDEKLSKINKLKGFHFEESEFNLLRKVNFYKYLSKTFLGITGLSIIGSIYSFISFISFFVNPALATIPFSSSIVVLITSVISLIGSGLLIKRLDKKHNSLCDAYYLNEELFGNNIYDLNRILEISNHYREQRDNVVLEQIDNEKRIIDYKEEIKKLDLFLQEINVYKDSLDEIVNTFIEVTMPGELKEKMETPFVKVKK